MIRVIVLLLLLVVLIKYILPEGFNGKQDTFNIRYLYTFHPDPIYSIDQLGERNWTSALKTFYNFDEKLVEATPCEQGEETYNEYKYLTRLEVPSNINDEIETIKSTEEGLRYANYLISYNYVGADDCACKNLNTNVDFGFEIWTAPSPKAAVCTEMGGDLIWLNSIWFSISQKWINENIKGNSKIKTAYLQDSKWFPQNTKFHDEWLKACSSKSQDEYLRTMENILNKYLFTSSVAGEHPSINILDTNKNNYPNFCTGENLSNEDIMYLDQVFPCNVNTCDKNKNAESLLCYGNLDKDEYGEKEYICSNKKMIPSHPCTDENVKLYCEDNVWNMCFTELRENCGDTKTTEECKICAGNKQHIMKDANCTDKLIQRYCKDFK